MSKGNVVVIKDDTRLDQSQISWKYQTGRCCSCSRGPSSCFKEEPARFVHSLIFTLAQELSCNSLFTRPLTYNNIMKAALIDYPRNDKYRRDYLEALEPYEKNRWMVCVEVAKYDPFVLWPGFPHH